MHVSIYECESTGGSEWVLEQTVHLDDFTRPTSTLDPRVSVDSNLFVYSRSGRHCFLIFLIVCRNLHMITLKLYFSQFQVGPVHEQRPQLPQH